MDKQHICYNKLIFIGFQMPEQRAVMNMTAGIHIPYSQRTILRLHCILIYFLIVSEERLVIWSFSTLDFFLSV